jgi:hypothetical protein
VRRGTVVSWCHSLTLVDPGPIEWVVYIDVEPDAAEVRYCEIELRAIAAHDPTRAAAARARPARPSKHASQIRVFFDPRFADSVRIDVSGPLTDPAKIVRLKGVVQELVSELHATGAPIPTPESGYLVQLIVTAGVSAGAGAIAKEAVESVVGRVRHLIAARREKGEDWREGDGYL